MTDDEIGSDLPAERGGDKWDKHDADATFLQMLDQRRATHDAAMWQVPGLTVAAQAFLLTVLTDDSVPNGVRWGIFGAGALTCLAAALALVLNRAREVFYSEVIWHYSKRFGINDVRRRTLARLKLEHAEPENEFQRLDARLRERAAALKPPGYWAWLLALLAFILADIVACIWS